MMPATAECVRQVIHRLLHSRDGVVAKSAATLVGDNARTYATGLERPVRRRTPRHQSPVLWRIAKLFVAFGRDQRPVNIKQDKIQVFQMCYAHAFAPVLAVRALALG